MPKRKVKTEPEVVEEIIEEVKDKELKDLLLECDAISIKNYNSPNLNQSIGLAMIKGGNNLIGQKFFVTVSGKTQNIPVEIVNPVFIDPENKRLTS